MTWLLKLYPPRWRRRYGAEFLALIAPQPFSIGTALDIVGGAIDAWTQPQSHLSTRVDSRSEGGTTMLAKALRLRCAGYGAKTTVVDGLKGAAVIIGASLLSVVLSYWLRQEDVDSSYTTALMANGWLIGCILSMRYTSLKGWPGRTQAVFMGVLVSVIVALALLSVG